MLASQAVTFYISTSGSDSADGLSPSTPWASARRALDAITLMRAGGPLLAPVEVNFADGEYFLGEALAFAPASGGSGANTVTLQPLSRAPGRVLLSGGRRIGGPWTAEPALGADVFSAALDAATWPESVVRQLFAPLPGGGYARRSFARLPIEQYAGVAYGARNATVTLGAGSALRSLTAAQVEGAFVTLFHTWTSSVGPVFDWAPPTFATGWTSEVDCGSNSRMFLSNVRGVPAALTPGSFLFDARLRRLTYRLAGGEDEGVLARLVAPALPEAIVAAGSAAQPVESVSLVNLTIAHTTASLEEDCAVDGCSYQSCADSHFAAVHLHGAKNFALAGVEVAHVGQYGVWVEEACTSISLARCHLHDLGMGGLRVGPTASGVVGAPQRTSGVAVSDSVVEDGGHTCDAGTGVLWHSADGGVIEHNLVRDFSYTGISAGWTWTYEETSTFNVTIRKNRVTRIGRGVLSDLSGIYLVGPMPGSLVESNYVDNITYGGNGAHAFYADQACSGVTWRGNVGATAQSALFNVHYAMNNTIENNILFSPTLAHATWPCSYPLDCDLTGLRSGKHADGSGEGAFSQFSFVNNIIVLAGDGDGVPGDANATLFVTAVDDGLANMTFARNLYWRASPSAAALQFPSTQAPTSFAEWQASGRDAGSVVADPLIADAAAGNWSLLPGSPALAMGFQQVDVSDVGPR